MDKPQSTRRRKARRRVMVLLVLCCAVFVLFLARLAWLQFAMADHYAQKMAEASSASYTLPQHAARGAITDRSGTVLAQDETVYDVYLRVPAPPGTNLRETVNTHLHTIYPVADTKLDNMVGVVFLKDLFGRMDAPDFDLKAIVRPPQYFPQNQSVYNAMEQLKQGHIKYGLVTDEFGSIEGIVTLQDILKALIGDLPELGEEPDIVQREDGTYLVDGQCPFYDFLAHFDMECLYTNHYYNTLSGLILKILEHIPQTGEKLTWYNFEFEIVDMDGARIDKVLVRVNREGE